jgi:hypothetical protein
MDKTLCLGHEPPPEHRRCMMIVTGGDGPTHQCINRRGHDVHQTGPRHWAAVEDAEGAFCAMHCEQLAALLNGYARPGRYDLQRTA